MSSEDNGAGGGPPLAGVKVVEIGGGIAAGFAARQFAGYGADVVRIEPWEERPPLTEYEALYLLAGKTRITATPEEFARLARAADVVIEDGMPGTLARLGVPVDALRAANPALVVVSITPFGQTGPYRDFKATNLVSFAMGGIMGITGDRERHPLVTGGANQAHYWGGLHGFSAAVTALVGAQLQGEGDWLDISMQACAAGTLELYGSGTAMGGPVMPRLGNQTLAEWGIYPCIDGYVGVFTLQRQVKGLFDAMGKSELYTPDAFADPLYRRVHVEEMTVLMYEFTLQYTMQELLDLGRQWKVPIGAAKTPGELLESEAFAERGVWDEVQSDHGPLKVPGRVLPGFGWNPLTTVHPVQAGTAALGNAWTEAVTA
jgi:CoA:oxalate CoA-transferase